jgi:hypothetical protein
MFGQLAFEQRHRLAFEVGVDDRCGTGLALAKTAMAIVDEDGLAFDSVAHMAATAAALSRCLHLDSSVSFPEA